jgi:hypothetical protein
VNLFTPIEEFIKNNLIDKTYKVWGQVKYSSGYLLLVVICVYSFPKLSTHIVVDPLFYPVGSLEFIKQNNISGNLAIPYNWGSYAFWKLYPQCKVLIDGRYEEVYPDTVYNKAILFSEHKADWQAVLRDYHTDIIVLSKRKYSPSDIITLTDWKLVYQDTSSVLLLQKDKVKPVYVYPGNINLIYRTEDFSKKVNLN